MLVAISGMCSGTGRPSTIARRPLLVGDLFRTKDLRGLLGAVGFVQAGHI